MAAGDAGSIHRRPFTIAELRTMFAAAPYPAGPRDVWFWLPLLGLFTGARLGELAQLDTSDVAQRDGVLVLLIREDAVTNKRLKTKYAAKDWRNLQNFVGETVGGYQEIVHCIFPKPDDVADIMHGMMESSKILIASDIDPIVAAAVLSFGFVFMHPFEDGNNRIHRFIIHHILAQKGLTPPGIIFPVSAPMVRNQAAYDAALETFSKRIMPYVDWHWEYSEEGDMVAVQGETDYLYGYFDVTILSEYLYEKVIETIRNDLREEIEFISVFDKAKK